MGIEHRQSKNWIILKKTAFIHYFFSGIFLLARVFQNVGGKFNFIPAILLPIFFLVWIILIAYGLILIVYGLFKYRKLPLSVLFSTLFLFSVPFLTSFTYRYTQPIIFRHIQLPYYQQVLKDIEKIKLGSKKDLSKEPLMTNIKTPFSDWADVSNIPNTKISIVKFGVGSTGAVGTHWGYVYCSDEKINLENIPEFAGKVKKYNANWYSWSF